MGHPNFELYNSDFYIAESFNCWKIYSRKYLMLLKKYLDREQCEIDKNEIKSVLDLGCGCAYSTVALKSIFPDAYIMATNLSGTLQFNIDEYVTSNIDGCDMYDESLTFNLPSSPDLIFASEFFEHLYEPIEFAINLITTYHPKYIVFANTFTKMSLGHFSEYKDGSLYLGKDMSRKFNKTLRDMGYSKIDTGFFNNRPQIYKVNSNSSSLF